MGSGGRAGGTHAAMAGGGRAGRRNQCRQAGGRADLGAREIYHLLTLKNAIPENLASSAKINRTQFAMDRNRLPKALYVLWSRAAEVSPSWGERCSFIFPETERANRIFHHGSLAHFFWTFIFLQRLWGFRSLCLCLGFCLC